MKHREIVCLEDMKLSRKVPTRFLAFGSILSSGGSCWNTKSLVSNLLVLLCFETVEKGKVTAFKGTPALMQRREIHPTFL